jgi:hypothetical protein
VVLSTLKKKKFIGYSLWGTCRHPVGKNPELIELKIKIIKIDSQVSQKTLLTDSIYISADYAIIRRYNPMMAYGWRSIVFPDNGIICRNIF